MPYFEYIIKLLNLTPREKVGKSGTGHLPQYDRNMLTNVKVKMKGGNFGHTESASTGRHQFLIPARDLAFGMC